jgi:hypothetical protein
MKLSPQSKTVLSHLRTESHITSWQAEGVYRIRRLASRIDEIVAVGYDVLKTEAKDATGQRYIRYSLTATQKRYAGPINPARARCVRLSLEIIESTMRDLGHCECAIDKLITALKESA